MAPFLGACGQQGGQELLGTTGRLCPGGRVELWFWGRASGAAVPPQRAGHGVPGAPCCLGQGRQVRRPHPCVWEPFFLRAPPSARGPPCMGTAMSGHQPRVG